MSRRDSPRSSGGARRESADEVLERRYRRLLAWYPAAYRAANEDDMLGVALARSASGQRWPEPGEAVNLIVSGIGERLAGMLRRPDQRDTAAVMAIAGPVLMAAAAARTAAGPFMLDPVLTTTHTSPRMLVTGIALAAWWALVALAGMLRWRRAAAAGACLGLAGQVVVLTLTVANYFGTLTVAYWQVGVALVTAASALDSADREVSVRASTGAGRLGRLVTATMPVMRSVWPSRNPVSAYASSLSPKYGWSATVNRSRPSRSARVASRTRPAASAASAPFHWPRETPKRTS